MGRPRGLQRRRRLADKPNSKEAYRRIKARQRRESRDEAEKAARDAAVALNEELPSDREEAAAIAQRQAAAAPRTAKPRWRPGQSDPVPVKAPNDAAFAATFLEPADWKGEANHPTGALRGVGLQGIHTVGVDLSLQLARNR